MGSHLGTMKDLLEHELQDLYSAENQLLEALPKMAEAASQKSLKSAFEKHLKETEQQIKRLQDAVKGTDLELEGEKCKGMEGLIKEGEDIIESDGDASVKDAALIGAAQRVEHYEMAGYGTVRTFAKLLGYDDMAEKLQRTLDQEGTTDEKLTKLAEDVINPKAADA